MFESLSLPCEKGLFVVLFALGNHPAPGGFPSKGVPVSSVRYPVSPPPHGTRCTGSRCCCSAFGSSQRMLPLLFVRHIAQIFSCCSLYILSTPYLYITENYILCFRLVSYNILCFYCFRVHSFGRSISGSSSASLYRSAICCADCCGMPFCCPAGTGAVSAMPYATLQAKIKFAFVPV